MAITKPFDVSKFRKSITKSIDGISVGFRDPDTWISTNNRSEEHTSELQSH